MTFPNAKFERAKVAFCDDLMHRLATGLQCKCSTPSTRRTQLSYDYLTWVKQRGDW